MLEVGGYLVDGQWMVLFSFALFSMLAALVGLTEETPLALVKLVFVLLAVKCLVLGAINFRMLEDAFTTIGEGCVIAFQFAVSFLVTFFFHWVGEKLRLTLKWIFMGHG